MKEELLNILIIDSEPAESYDRESANSVPLAIVLSVYSFQKYIGEQLPLWEMSLKVKQIFYFLLHRYCDRSMLYYRRDVEARLEQAPECFKYKINLLEKL